MKRRSKISIPLLVLSAVYLFGICLFYYKYVPLVAPFQTFFIPILILCVAITAIKKEWGILLFVFIFPLINNLPYFFGIHGKIPHAPTALILFLFFFLGWLINSAMTRTAFDFKHPIFKPLSLLSLIAVLSCIITLFRYSNFFPFLSDGIHDVVVNVNGVRAGGALMSTVFSSLNYLTGFLFFLILLSATKSKDFIKKVLVVLCCSAFLSLTFSLLQKYYSISLGNTPYWVMWRRINATFKDPNSLGVFLAAFILILLGIALHSRKMIKLPFIFLIILALFIFPSVGSRSGLLGLVIALPVFLVMLLVQLRLSPKKRALLLISFFLICVLLAVSLTQVSEQASLVKRIKFDIQQIAEKSDPSRVFTGRLNFWLAASEMIKDYPLTGVGVGAFIVEMPNYLKTMGRRFIDTDSAENYFLQVGSELGIVGLFAVFWLFYEIIRQAKRTWSTLYVANDKNILIFIGMVSGLVALFLNFLLHTYIGSYEIKYFFWLLVALVFAYYKQGIEPPEKKKFHPGFRSALVAAPLIFGALFLWNSLHSLSIASRTEKYGWGQDFGLYETEKDTREFYFQWTKKSAGISADNIGENLIIPMLASHPDVEKNPVKVKLYLADRHFRKKSLIQEMTLYKKEWFNFEYPLPDSYGERIRLVFEIDRTWIPYEWLGTHDPRNLGIALGDLWFTYPSEVPQEKIKRIETFQTINWEGKHKAMLTSNGTSKIVFNISGKNATLRLKTKGQQALNLGPFIIIRLDDRIIGKTMLMEEGWTSLILTPVLEEGDHVLSVSFTNDFNNVSQKQDRNVFLGDLDILYLE